MGNPSTTKGELSNVENVDAEGCYVLDRVDLAERSRTNIPSLWLYCSCPYVSHCRQNLRGVSSLMPIWSIARGCLRCFMRYDGRGVS